MNINIINTELGIRLIAFSLLFFSYIESFSQNIINTSGEAQIEWPSSISEDIIKKQAQDLAIINALEKAYGKVIIQGNSTYIQNYNNGEKTETHSSFNMIANSWVYGECLEVLSSNFETFEGSKKINNKVEKFIEIKCNVIIKAKKIESNTPNINAFTQDCLNPRCMTERFINGDTLYINFTSPESGYLSIFLDDGNASFRLLPYSGMDKKFESGVPVLADKNYILFSNLKEHNYFTDYDFEEDTYILTCKKNSELNRIFFVFSKNPLLKKETKQII